MVTVDRQIYRHTSGEQIYDWSVPARIRRRTRRPANVCAAAVSGKCPVALSVNAAAAGAISETALVALAVAVVAALVTAIVLASRNDASCHTALTQASAKAAIQEYLDALSEGDDQTVARHTLCGLFDAVKEHRSDLALASLSSDAFRK